MKKLILALVLSLITISTAWARSLTAEGVGATETDAEREALRSAVEQAVGTYVDSATLVEKQSTIQDKILVHSQGYINNYKVLGRWQRQDGLWKVKVLAEIDPLADSRLMSELARQGIIHSVLRNPIIDVRLNYAENSLVGDRACVALADFLIEAGFNRAAVDEREKPDFIIWGRAKSLGGSDVGKYLGDGKHSTGTKSARVNIVAQLYQVSTGKTIALDSKTVAAVASDEGYALVRASEKAGREMGRYIVEKLLILGSGPALKEK